MSKPSRKSRPGLLTRKEPGPLVPGPWLDGAGRSPLSMWREGVFMALVPVVIGLIPLLTGHVEYRLRGGGPFRLEGGAAQAYGLAWIAAGAILHFHFFWASHPKLSDYEGMAKAAAILVLLGALGALVYLQLGF